MKQTSVLIIGGGISGLACAYELGRSSVDFLLLEKQKRLGGTVRTERVDDFILDTGPDAFLTQKPAAVGLCKEIGLESRLIPTNPAERNVFVLHRGALHPLPEGMVLTVPTRILPFVSSSLFSPLGKLRMGLELFVPPRRDDGEESIGSFVERRLGREALERLAEPLLAGIHSGTPDRLSMDKLFPRFVALEKKHGSLIRGMRKMRPKRGKGSSETMFMSLAGGMVELVEALRERLPVESILYGQKVCRLSRDGRHYRAETTSGETFRADAVVLSMPLHATRGITESLSTELSSALANHRSVSTAIVFLAFPKGGVRHPLNGYGFVVPASEGRRIAAGTFISTKFPNRSPESHVLMRAFLGGARDPAVLTLADDELIELARTELGEILGGLPTPTLSRIYRWDNGTPQVEVGHGEKLARLDRILEEFPGLQIVANGLRGVGIPDCIADGRRAAREIVERLASRQELQ